MSVCLHVHIRGKLAGDSRSHGSPWVVLAFTHVKALAPLNSYPIGAPSQEGIQYSINKPLWRPSCELGTA
jgi:hypothetical protein